MSTESDSLVYKCSTNEEESDRYIKEVNEGTNCWMKRSGIRDFEQFICYAVGSLFTLLKKGCFISKHRFSSTPRCVNLPNGYCVQQ